MSAGRTLLILGGGLSLAAAALHVAVIFGGPAWYRFFGAGEGMARAAERGAWQPVVITLGITAVLTIWAGYAFSGARLIGRLPLLRTGLIVISTIYMLRALVLPHAMIFMPDVVTPFLIWSSLIVLAYGLAYSIGTWLHWPQLSPKGR